MKVLSLIFLLMVGFLLAGSESEYFLGNIIGMIILFILLLVINWWNKIILLHK